MAGLEYVLVMAVAYLIGSVPSAYLLTKAVTGRDIRELGTGNVGVMNTAAQVGLFGAAVVFLLEAGKGAAAAMLGRYLTGTQAGGALATVSAVAGVNWCVWLGFRGGRGTTTGVFGTLAVSIPVVVGMAVVWAASYIIFRNSFYATRVNIVALPITAGVLEQSLVLAALAGAGACLLLLRHRKETDDHLVLANAPVGYEQVAAERD
jgi:glycerol-3-phosphate acyltransferase PlsY